MTCKDTSLMGPCVETTLDATGSGAANVPRIFPTMQADGTPTELPLLDSVASEPTKLSGTPFRLYSVRTAKNRHPLYGEPSRGRHWEFQGPWEMMGALVFDQIGDANVTVDSPGSQESATATLYLSRKEQETCEAPEPKVGDVIHLWNKKPFASDFEFWDVVQSNHDGQVFSSEAFTQYVLSLTRRTVFDPGRKILGSSVVSPVHEEEGP